jgi:hypothetical protein
MQRESRRPTVGAGSVFRHGSHPGGCEKYLPSLLYARGPWAQCPEPRTQQRKADDMTDQENVARFIMRRSQGWSFNRITVGFDAARTIGPSEFSAASPKNTRNGKIRSKSVKIGKPPLRHVTSAPRRPSAIVNCFCSLAMRVSARWEPLRSLRLLLFKTPVFPARAAKPGAKWCKIVQNSAKRCNRLKPRRNGEARPDHGSHVKNGKIR